MSHTCYAPNAIPLPEYEPCNISDNTSLCCRPGHICLTNGLCANGQGEYYNGGCTDKTYKASICPSVCTGEDNFVVECQGSVIPDGGFCCSPNGSTTCCDSLNNNLNLKASAFSAIVESAPSSSESASTSTSETESSSSSVKTSKASLITSLSFGSALTTDGITIRSVPTTVTNTLEAVPSPSANHTDSGSHERLTKGQSIGLGTGLLIAFFASVILLIGAYKIWKMHYDKKETERTTDIANLFYQVQDSEIHELQNLPAAFPELPSVSRLRDRNISPFSLPHPGNNVQELDASQEFRWSDATTAAPEYARTRHVHQSQDSQSRPGTPTSPALRPNNNLGPLPMPAATLPVIPTRNPSRKSLPIPQGDGAPAPPLPSSQGISPPMQFANVMSTKTYRSDEAYLKLFDSQRTNVTRPMPQSDSTSTPSSPRPPARPPPPQAEDAISVDSDCSSPMNGINMSIEQNSSPILRPASPTMIENLPVDDTPNLRLRHTSPSSVVRAPLESNGINEAKDVIGPLPQLNGGPSHQVPSAPPPTRDSAFTTSSDASSLGRFVSKIEDGSVVIPSPRSLVEGRDIETEDVPSPLELAGEGGKAWLDQQPARKHGMWGWEN